MIKNTVCLDRFIGLSVNWLIGQLVCRLFGVSVNYHPVGQLSFNQLSANFPIGQLVCRSIVCRSIGLSINLLSVNRRNSLATSFYCFVYERHFPLGVPKTKFFQSNPQRLSTPGIKRIGHEVAEVPLEMLSGSFATILQKCVRQHRGQVSDILQNIFEIIVYLAYPVYL